MGKIGNLKRAQRATVRRLARQHADLLIDTSVAGTRQVRRRRAILEAKRERQRAERERLQDRLTARAKPPSKQGSRQ